MTAPASLPARELDALVAREVMGWTPWMEKRGEYTYVVWQEPGDMEPWFRHRNHEYNRARYSECESIDWHRHIVTRVGDTFRPSTDGNAMLAVLDRLRERGWIVGTWRHPARDDVTVILSRDRSDRRLTRTADTLPRAVCLAALAAVGGE